MSKTEGSRPKRPSASRPDRCEVEAPISRLPPGLKYNDSQPGMAPEYGDGAPFMLQSKSCPKVALPPKTPRGDYGSTRPTQSSQSMYSDGRDQDRPPLKSSRSRSNTKDRNDYNDAYELAEIRPRAESEYSRQKSSSHHQDDHHRDDHGYDYLNGNDDRPHTDSHSRPLKKKCSKANVRDDKHEVKRNSDESKSSGASPTVKICSKTGLPNGAKHNPEELKPSKGSPTTKKTSSKAILQNSVRHSSDERMTAKSKQNHHDTGNPSEKKRTSDERKIPETGLHKRSQGELKKIRTREKLCISDESVPGQSGTFRERSKSSVAVNSLRKQCSRTRSNTPSPPDDDATNRTRSKSNVSRTSPDDNGVPRPGMKTRVKSRARNEGSNSPSSPESSNKTLTKELTEPELEELAFEQARRLQEEAEEEARWIVKINKSFADGNERLPQVPRYDAKKFGVPCPDDGVSYVPRVMLPVNRRHIPWHTRRNPDPEDVPPDAPVGAEVWYCCWCQNINPRGFDMCMICEHEYCENPGVGCKLYLSRVEVKFQDPKGTLGQGGPKPAENYVWDELFKGRSEWEQYGKIGFKDKWSIDPNKMEPPKSAKLETKKKRHWWF